MRFERKYLLTISLIVIMLTSLWLSQALPTWGIDSKMSNVGAEAGSDTLNATGINDGSIGAEPTVQAESSYRRGRDFERWAYSNRTVRLVQYMGPRFVRHHSTGQFVDLVFEDCYGSEGYYLVQNAYIGLKIYDDGTVMYDPDMESVAVEEERIMVQVYDNVSSTWKTLNLGVPFLNVDVNNVSEIVVTRVQNCSLGMLEVSYVVKSGELMKYDIAFTSYSLFQGLFKVVQELSGIQGSDVTYERTDGSDDTLIVNASKELLAPFLSFERDGTPVLTVSLQDLGHRDVTGEWTSDVLEKIILVNNTDGVKAEIVIGDFNLRWKEALSIDPLVTTIHVMHNDDDTYVEYWYDERASGYENNRAETLIHLGRHYSEHWDPVWEEWHHVQFFYRIFLRWPILIPDGGIVQSAYLNVCVSASPSYDFTANIRTLDNPNCSAFTASGSTIYYYGVMANTTNWQISGSWEEGKWKSVDVTQNVKDFIGRSDYALGNYLGLRIDELSCPGGVDHYRRFYSHDSGVSKAPRLIITFEYPYDERFVEPLENWSFEDASAWSTDSLLLHMDEDEGKTAYNGGPESNDGSINARHGTVSGATWVDGKSGKALSFNGANDYATVGYASSLEMSTFTVAFWAKASILTGERCVIGNRELDYTFDVKFRSNGLHGDIGDGQQWLTTAAEYVFTPSLNTWYHVVYVVTSGGDCKVYLNGAYKTTITFTGTPKFVRPNGSVKIGQVGYGDEWFSGLIDEVYVWNRTLSAPEVFNVFSGVDVRDGLMGEWTFDDSTAVDTHMWTAGKVGSALNFNGKDDCVKISPTATFSGMTAIRLEAWIRFHSSPSGTVQEVCQKWRGWTFGYNSYGWWFELYATTGEYIGAYIDAWSPMPGIWYHVVCTYDGTAMMTYINDNLLASHPQALDDRTIWNDPGTSWIGVGAAGWEDGVYDRYFDGVIDEVKVSDGKTTVTVDDSEYMHGKRSWEVEGPSNGDVVVAQLLSREVVEYIRNRKDNQNRGACFSFSYKPDGNISSGEKNKACAEIQYMVNGAWQTVVSGDTVKPNSADWWHGLVRVAQLPTNTEQVKVRIKGSPYSGEGFKAWIDLALLSTYYYKTVNDPTYGDIALVTNIYHSDAIPHPEWDGFVSMGISITADTKGSYSVGKIRDLKVELLPNNASVTTQQARLVILHAYQTNDRDVSIDPRAQEVAINTALQNIEIGAGLILSGVSWIVGAGIGGVAFPALLKVGLYYTGIGMKFFKLQRVNLHHPLAEGETSYSIWETFDYTGEITKQGTTFTDRIDWANGHYYFDWRYRTGSDDIFAVKISATVEWYEWYDSDPYNPGDEYWRYAGQTPISTVISLGNYWQ